MLRIGGQGLVESPMVPRAVGWGASVLAHLSVAENGEHPHVVGLVLAGDLDAIVNLSRSRHNFQAHIRRESERNGQRCGARMGCHRKTLFVVWRG